MVSKLHQEFLLVLLWSVLILATDDSSNRLQDSIEVSDGFIFFANLFPFPHHKLDSRPSETRAVDTEQDCIEICSKTPRCRSLNFKHGTKESGKFDCHLLDDSKFNSSALFQKNEDYHPYSLAAPCEHNPCKNGGTCYSVLEKYNFNCLCAAHFGGKKCDLLYKSCAELRDVGVNESGIYMIQDQRNASVFNVYCDQEHSEGGWTMVFKAVSGIGSDVSHLWSASHALFEKQSEVLNLNSLFKNHYKNHLVNKWQTVGPKKARVALYKDGSEVFSIMFDTSNSNKKNWFTKDRVISSPWTDLKRNLSQYFSITGAAGRRFYISGSHSSCGEDYGWLSITQHLCTYEKSLPNTSFIYSRLQTKTNWNVQENVGVADVLVVYIR